MEEKQREGLIKDTVRDTGFEKAAKFLIVLGKEEASRILKQLSHEEIEGIVKEIARIRKVEHREAEKIIKEFGYLMKTPGNWAQGGLERAREMLFTAFGTEKGNEMFTKIQDRTLKDPFSFLYDLDFAQVMSLLKHESVPVIGAILSYMEPRFAAKILTALPTAVQKSVAGRIARITKISPEILRKAEKSLKEKIKTQGEVTSQEIDGQEALISIMKFLNLGTEKMILEELAGVDPELSQSLKERLFTMDVTLRMRDMDLQSILRDFTDQEIALLLKGQDEDIKRTILKNLSERRKLIVKAEYDALGKVKKSDADGMARDFLNYIRKSVEKGDTLIMEKDDEYV